jgi:UDP-2-acetamido-3-amino-2,3-dideoxy-glucuronate N-acetyltransferase
MSNLDPSVFVHDKAYTESDDIGPRTRLWPFSYVMKGARIGADCNICPHAFIERGVVLGDRVTVKNGVQIFERVTIEDEVFLGPNMVFTNDPNPRIGFKKKPEDFLPTRVQKGASIGANATIVCGVTIGPHAFIGAGAVVIRDVPAHAMIVGNPGRQIGWMCICGKKLPEALACACGRRYRFKNGAPGLEIST